MGFSNMLKVVGLFAAWAAIIAATWLASTPQNAPKDAAAPAEVAAETPSVNSMEHLAAPPANDAAVEKKAVAK